MFTKTASKRQCFGSILITFRIGALPMPTALAHILQSERCFPPQQLQSAIRICVTSRNIACAPRCDSVRYFTSAGLFVSAHDIEHTVALTGPQISGQAFEKLIVLTILQGLQRFDVENK